MDYSRSFLSRERRRYQVCYRAISAKLTCGSYSTRKAASRWLAASSCIVAVTWQSRVEAWAPNERWTNPHVIDRSYTWWQVWSGRRLGWHPGYLEYVVLCTGPRRYRMLRENLTLMAALGLVVASMPSARADLCFHFGSGGGTIVARGQELPKSDECKPFAFYKEGGPAGAVTSSICVDRNRATVIFHRACQGLLSPHLF